MFPWQMAQLHFREEFECSVHTHVHTYSINIHTQSVKALQPLCQWSPPCVSNKNKDFARLNTALCWDQDVAQSNPLRQDPNPGCNPLRRCTGCILIQRPDFGDRRSGFQEVPRGSSPALGRDKKERKSRWDVCFIPSPFFPPLTPTGNIPKRVDVFLSASY